MPIERKVLFPLAHIAYLIVAILLLISVIGSIIVAGYKFNEAKKFSSGMRISAQEIIDDLKPFGEANEAKVDEESSPFGRAISPSEFLNKRFPEAKPGRLLELLPPENRNEKTAKYIEMLVDEAKNVGDSPNKYIDNALDVLSSVKNEEERLKALELYHDKRTKYIKANKLKRADAMSQASIYAISAVSSFIALLLIALILVLLAIERNTRSKL